VGVLFFMTIPGLAVGLVALAALDRLGLWLHGRSGLPWYRDGRRPAPAPGLDELQAVFTPARGKRSINAGPSSCFATMNTTPRPRTPASISTGGES
jgi:hypothetical protein